MSRHDPSRVIAAAEQLLTHRQWAAARSKALPYISDRVHGVRARAVLANAAALSGDHAEAATQFRILLQALPSHPGIRSALSMAHNNLGSAALQRGASGEARGHYENALKVDERNALAWFNLGACAFSANDLTLASRCYARCSELDPSRLEARLQWALCERLRGDTAKARAALAGFAAHVLPVELAAKVGAEWVLLGEPDSAARAYAGALVSTDSAMLLRVAQAQLGAGDAVSARASAGRAMALARDDRVGLQSALVSALALPAVPANSDEIAQARAGFAEGIDQLARDWPAERLRASTATLDDLAHSHFGLAYHGENDIELARSFGRWYCAAAAAIDARSNAIAATGSSARRVALVSARWTKGTISAYFGSWLSALRAAGWEVHAYHLGSNRDDWTSEIAARVDVFRHLSGPLSDSVAALRAAAPAVILYPEVGLSPRVHPLAALRLAPVQAAAWGHPVTTGLASIDYCISCADMEPDDGARHHVERLALLPRLGTCYQRPPRAPTVGRAALGLPEDRPIYLAPHTPVKVHPDFDALLAGIAERDHAAAVVMFEDAVPALTARLQRRLARRFADHGIDASRHLYWLPRAAPDHFRSVLAASDVLLDTIGFSGGNTSLDAIAQGLPLVTLPGAQMRSRQSAAMLRLCGVEELIAEDAGDLVDRAVHLASDHTRATALRQRLLQGSTELFDDQRPLTALVTMLESWIG